MENVYRSNNVTICGIEIDQDFIVQKYDANTYTYAYADSNITHIVQTNISTKLDLLTEEIEYLIIKVGTLSSDDYKLDISNINLFIQIFGRDLQEIRNGVFYNKVTPYLSLCKKVHDEQTNKLLKSMIQNKDKKSEFQRLLFYPFINGPGSGELQLDKYRESTTRIITVQRDNPNNHHNIAYTLLWKIKKKRIIEQQNNMYDTIQIVSEIMEKSFNINQALNWSDHQLGLTLSNGGDTIDSIILNIKSNKKLNYKSVRYISLGIYGKILAKIPIKYLYMYNKVIHNINMERFTRNNQIYIPILLKDIISIYHIPLFLLGYTLELIVEFNNKSIYDYNIERNIRKSYNDNKILIDDIWNKILNYLDDNSWSNVRRTCKYIYFLEYDNIIEDRHKKYRIDDDVQIMDISGLIRYNFIHSYDKVKACNNNTLYELLDIREFSSIDMSNISIDVDNDKIEWIILDIEYKCTKNIVSNIDMIISYNDNNKYVHRLEISEFENKMHNPSENRYQIKIPNSLLDDSKKIHLDIKLNKYNASSSDMLADMYVAYKKILYLSNSIGAYDESSEAFIAEMKKKLVN